MFERLRRKTTILMVDKGEGKLRYDPHISRMIKLGGHLVVPFLRGKLAWMRSKIVFSVALHSYAVYEISIQRTFPHC